MDWVGWPEESDSLSWSDPTLHRHDRHQLKGQSPKSWLSKLFKTQQLIVGKFVEEKWAIVKIFEIFLIQLSPLQTQRRWTPSSTSRSREVALLSVMWWWVNETCHRFFKHFSKTAALPSPARYQWPSNTRRMWWATRRRGRSTTSGSPSTRFPKTFLNKFVDSPKHF